MNKALLVMISCSDQHEAKRIGEILLKKKYAACVQIVNAVDSIFLWPPKKNQLDYANEALLLVKTLDTKWNTLEKAVISAHSYKNPEIIAVTLSRVTKKYLTWLTSELSR